MQISLGERLRGLREDADLTQAQLGAALGMTQRKISYMERDQIEPNVGDILSICRFFRISADFLLGLSGGSRHSER